MKKKLKIMLLAILCLCFAGGAAGCALMDDAVNDIKGDLVGNGYTIRTYDNYGQKVMTTVGDKINVQGIRLRQLLTTVMEPWSADTSCHP